MNLINKKNADLISLKYNDNKALYIDVYPIAPQDML